MIKVSFWIATAILVLAMFYCSFICYLYSDAMSINYDTGKYLGNENEQYILASHLWGLTISALALFGIAYRDVQTQ